MTQDIDNRKKRLIELTDAFCDELLDEEYKSLAKKLIEKMARKKHVPFESGKIEIWAAATIYCLGQINFLDDKLSEPYLEKRAICEAFGTSLSTTSQKAKVIRDMFKLNYFDPNFSIAAILEKSPMNDVVFVNGLFIPKSMLR